MTITIPPKTLEARPGRGRALGRAAPTATSRVIPVHAESQRSVRDLLKEVDNCLLLGLLHDLVEVWRTRPHYRQAWITGIESARLNGIIHLFWITNCCDSEGSKSFSPLWHDWRVSHGCPADDLSIPVLSNAGKCGEVVVIVLLMHVHAEHPLTMAAALWARRVLAEQALDLLQLVRTLLAVVVVVQRSPLKRVLSIIAVRPVAPAPGPLGRACPRQTQPRRLLSRGRCFRIDGVQL